MAAWDMWTVLGLLMSMGLCALANEQTSNSIIIRIYQLSIDKWNGGIKDDFALAVTDQANSYCADNLAKCGLNTHSIMFAPENVVHNDGSPNYKKPYLTVEFALTYPSGADTTNASTVDHVPRNALQALTIGAMDSFEDRTGYHIVDVGDEEFSIPPNTTLNIALCVVAVVLLLAVLVTCQVLNWKCGKSNNDEDDDQDLEKGKSSGSGKSDDVAMETRSLVETNSDAGTPETPEAAAMVTTENAEAGKADDNGDGDAETGEPPVSMDMVTVEAADDTNDENAEQEQSDPPETEEKAEEPETEPGPIPTEENNTETGPPEPVHKGSLTPTGNDNGPGFTLEITTPEVNGGSGHEGLNGSQPAENVDVETGPPEAISKDDVSKGDASASAPLELTSMETVKTKPDATNGAEYSAVNT